MYDMIIICLYMYLSACLSLSLYLSTYPSVYLTFVCVQRTFLWRGITISIQDTTHRGSNVLTLLYAEMNVINPCNFLSVTPNTSSHENMFVQSSC
jgi:hypothetical protein